MRQLLTMLLIGLSANISNDCYAQNKSKHCEEFTQTIDSEELLNYVSIDKGKCFLIMEHNNEGINVQAIIKDKTLQKKFLMQGLTMYIDITGKKNKKYYVSFPKSNPSMMFNFPQNEVGLDKRPIGQGPEMSIKPLVDMLVFESSILTANKEEVYIDRSKASVSMNNNDLVFTCTLPYSMIGKKVGKKELIAIGLSSEIEKMAGMNANGPQGGMPPNGGMGGGGGMPPNGGMGHQGGMKGGAPRGGMGQNGSMSEMAKAYSQWVVFSLK